MTLRFQHAVIALMVSAAFSDRGVEHDTPEPDTITVTPCALATVARELLLADERDNQFGGEFTHAVQRAMAQKRVTDNPMHAVARKLLARTNPATVARIRELTVQMLTTMRDAGVPREEISRMVAEKLMQQAQINPAQALITTEITAEAITEVFG